MDPLTITAGILGVATSISSLNIGIRWIASLKNAPAEFLDLQNEVSLPRTVYVIIYKI